MGQNMKFLKTAAAAAISVALLAGCNDETNNYHPTEPTPDPIEPIERDGRFAAYNLSFDRTSFEQLVSEMTLTAEKQDELMDKWFAGTLTDEEKAVAEKVIQIRNVAAVIQTERPAVLMMGEFNNDGTGENQDAMVGFRLNYLSVPQNGLGATSDDKKMLEPIQFGYSETFATNTGLLSDFDLDRDGKIALPGDAWGFGFYHGQYAFGLISMYPIDTANIRTFQNFKWKDMPGETNPTIVNCDDESNPIPAGMKCGDEWYSAEAWAEKPLSSKNHVDVPVLIPTSDGGTQTVHLLMSHPTPPVFDTVTKNNVLLNSVEVAFWNDYVSGSDYMYDDKGLQGGLADDASFMIMGDLNADPNDGDGKVETIAKLLANDNINTHATLGVYAPSSLGADECFTNGECGEWGTGSPQYVTSTFGLRVDYVMPSSDLNITDSGVFWPATFEEGRLLMNDERVGKYGDGKDISSDHRLVWVKAEF